MLLNGAGCYDSCPLWNGGQVPLKCLIIWFPASFNGSAYSLELVHY